MATSPAQAGMVVYLTIDKAFKKSIIIVELISRSSLIKSSIVLKISEGPVKFTPLEIANV